MTLQRIPFFLLALILVLTACGTQQTEADPVAVAVALTQTAAAANQSQTEPTQVPTVEKGTISGLVHGFAPPTPPLVIYAVDNGTGQWFSVETGLTDGETPFTLEVTPGNYVLFACPTDLANCAYGYSEDGWSLSTVNVSAGQTVTDILLQPPAMGECGIRMGFPASPDGRFQAVEPPPEDCTALADGELYPISPDTCADLALAAGQALEIPFAVTQVSVERSWNEQTGSACQIAARGNGNNFDKIMSIADALKQILLERGWIEQLQAPMCLGQGGFGPTGTDACYSQGDQICEAFVTVAPEDNALCDNIDGPIGNCLAAIAPEQRIFNISLTCAQGFELISSSGQEPEPIRVAFAPGEMSAQVSGQLVPGQIHRYVVNALQGQQLNAYLYPSGQASIAIWGADGTVLISDHADATDWVGPLPFTQDYFIDVKSFDTTEIDYTLDIVIPPLEEMGSAAGKICFPSEGIPAMTAYFEDTMNGLVTEIPIAQNQSTYEVDLAPGTYLAYAWLPGFTTGGLFSNAVPCGLSVDCTDHSPIAFQVNPGEMTSSIDICDWYLDPSGIPLP